MDAKNGHPAHDRFKARDGPRTSIGILIAIIIHALILIVWPVMTIPIDSFTTRREGRIIRLPPEAVELVPKIEIPKPPKPISRPALPVVVADLQFNTNITIPKITFEENPIPKLPPPPVAIEEDTAMASAPRFTPYTIKPEIKNRYEIQKLLELNYPAELLELKIEGTVMLWFFIDENGNPLKWLVAKSSGHRQFDKLALRLAPQFRFRPGYNRDQKVKVWVQVPIVFRIDR